MYYLHFLLFLSLGEKYGNLFLTDGNITGSPQSMEKRRSRAKLIVGGAHEMCKTIMSKVFICNDLVVLSILMQAAKCLSTVCRYYCMEFKDTIKQIPKIESRSIYNPNHVESVQMDCFTLIGNVSYFFQLVKPLLKDIEEEYKVIRVTQIALATSHYLQDFLLKHRDFHILPPPVFKPHNSRQSVWRY